MNELNVFGTYWNTFQLVQILLLLGLLTTSVIILTRRNRHLPTSHVLVSIVSVAAIVISLAAFLNELATGGAMSYYTVQVIVFGVLAAANVTLAAINSPSSSLTATKSQSPPAYAQYPPPNYGPVNWQGGQGESAMTTTPTPPPGGFASTDIPVNRTCENGHKNHDRAQFCGQCGVALPPPPPLTADQVHPLPPSQWQQHYGQPDGPPDERFRPQVMFLWLWWFIFSPVVLFLAPSYAKKAKAMGFKNHTSGRPATARYWFPFWLTLIGYAAIAALVITGVVAANNARSSYSSYSYTPYSPPTTSQQYSPPVSGSYPYSVTQESGDAQVLANNLENSTDITWDDGTTYGITTAIVESNTEPSSVTSYGWNVNVTLSNGGKYSYWASWDGSLSGGWHLYRRTH